MYVIYLTYYIIHIYIYIYLYIYIHIYIYNINTAARLADRILQFFEIQLCHEQNTTNTEACAWITWNPHQHGQLVV